MSDTPPVRRPRVARVARRTATVPLAIGLALIGTAVFARMVDSRGKNEDTIYGLPPLEINRMAAPVVPVAAKVTVAAPFVAPRGAVMLTATAPAPGFRMSPLGPVRTTAVGAAPREQLGGPTLVLDLFNGRNLRPATTGLTQDLGGYNVPGSLRPASPDPTGDAIAAAGPLPSVVSRAGLPLGVVAVEPPAGTDNERFAARVSGKETSVVQARRMENLDRLVPEGAILGAVLETALNSDLPGYARALVTKDVLSFDGSAVLIPAGSRVIGEYNSGVAQGASRIFIVWNRLIRPDGVSIALASPAVDELGRGGLKGKVNRHFLQRFGGAILLSVLTGGINAAAASVSRGSTVIVGTAGEASSLATQASRGSDIPPTIKTRQGALVRIFVARDLDFTSVGPAV